MLVLIMVVGLFCCCGQTTTVNASHDYNRAYIALPNGEVIEGKVSRWNDWNYGTVKVVVDDKTYYTHFTNVILVAE